MNEEPPQSLPPPPSPPDEPPESLSPKAAGETGCALVGGAIAGFVLFLVAGWTVLAVGRNGAFGIPYLAVAAIVAIWLATKPGYRGLAIGIFLGLGAVLLLIAICSGMKI